MLPLEVNERLQGPPFVLSTRRPARPHLLPAFTDMYGAAVSELKKVALSMFSTSPIPLLL